mgnify:FL=1
MKREDILFIRIKAGSASVQDFEDSYKENYECQTNYKYYDIGDAKEKAYLTECIEKNHLYHMLAAVYDGDRITETFMGCGQLIVKKDICGIRLFVKVKAGYNDTAENIIKLAGADIFSDIAVVRAPDISDKIGDIINNTETGKIKEICIA